MSDTTNPTQPESTEPAAASADTPGDLTGSAVQYLTRSAAAEACECHPDTIRRAEKKGLRTRKRDGVIEIAVTDLVAAGLLDPLKAVGDLTGAVAKSRTERDLEEARKAMAVADVKIEQLEARIRDLQEHDTFMRSLIKKQAA